VDKEIDMSVKFNTDNQASFYQCPTPPHILANVSGLRWVRDIALLQQQLSTGHLELVSNYVESDGDKLYVVQSGSSAWIQGAVDQGYAIIGMCATVYFGAKGNVVNPKMRNPLLVTLTRDPQKLARYCNVNNSQSIGIVIASPNAVREQAELIVRGGIAPALSTATGCPVGQVGIPPFCTAVPGGGSTPAPSVPASTSTGCPAGQVGIPPFCTAVPSGTVPGASTPAVPGWSVPSVPGWTSLVGGGDSSLVGPMGPGDDSGVIIGGAPGASGTSDPTTPTPTQPSTTPASTPADKGFWGSLSDGQKIALVGSAAVLVLAGVVMLKKKR